MPRQREQGGVEAGKDGSKHQVVCYCTYTYKVAAVHKCVSPLEWLWTRYAETLYPATVHGGMNDEDIYLLVLSHFLYFHKLKFTLWTVIDPVPSGCNPWPLGSCCRSRTPQGVTSSEAVGRTGDFDHWSHWGGPGGWGKRKRSRRGLKLENLW